MVAAIMALDRCIRHENASSAYDERGLLVFQAIKKWRGNDMLSTVYPGSCSSSNYKNRFPLVKKRNRFRQRENKQSGGPVRLVLSSLTGRLSCQTC